MTADTQQIPDIAATPAWQALQRHHDEIGEKHLRELFAEDPERGTQLALTVGDLYIDYSKHRVTRETLQLLIDLARTAGLEQRRDAMFSGVHINTSENRAVLHTALRMPRGVELVVDGQNVVEDVHAVLDKMGDFTDRLRSGEWTGATGERIKTVVNIGIGGSDLGPNDGVPGAAPLRRRGHLGAVRLQRRPRRPGGQARWTRPRHNAFHRRVEDVLHAGDADQRDRCAPLADRRARRRRGVKALRRGVDEQEAGRRLRHQHRQHVRLLGLGRRTLLGGLGDRIVGDGGHRPRAVRRLPGRVPPRRRALPHRAAGGQRAGAARPHRAVVQRVLRRADARGAAVLQRPVAVRRLSAAADHGVQRQVGARRRHAGHHRAPAKSSGANREPTASTRSTSCSTRARG